VEDTCGERARHDAGDRLRWRLEGVGANAVFSRLCAPLVAYQDLAHPKQAVHLLRSGCGGVPNATSRVRVTMQNLLMLNFLVIAFLVQMNTPPGRPRERG
jgi:hypothetical protein